MSKSFIKINKKLNHYELNIDIELPDSGITVLFGTSGSGKTSILNCIAGLTDCSGNIKINNHSWQSSDNGDFVKPYKRSLGYIFQDSMLFEHLNVFENLKYAMENKTGGTTTQMNQLIETFELSKLLESQIPNLSGGEKQRIALVRALIGTPDILLMDEPTASLDHDSKLEIFKEFIKIKNTLNIPIVYVTHSIDEVLKLADHIGFIEEGKLNEIIPIEKGLKHINKKLGHDDSGDFVIDGNISKYDSEYGLSTVKVGSLDFLIPGRLELNEKILLQLSASNISLSQVENRKSSILNIIPVIVEGYKESQSFYLIRLLAGDLNTILMAKITKKSFELLSVHKGQALFAQVKSINLIQ